MGSEVGGFSPIAGHPSVVFLNWIKDYEKSRGVSYLPRKTIPDMRPFSPLEFDEEYIRKHPPTPWTNRVEVIDCELEIEGVI